MAIYDKSKLYWLKLFDDFYRQDSIEWLLSEENGTAYVVLYQMLLLKTLNRNGELSKMLGNNKIKYTNQDIAKLTGLNEKLIEQGINNLIYVGLLERDQSGIMLLPKLNNMIGSSTKGAFKKSVQRKKKDKCPPDIDKDIKEDERNIYK
ncbi:MAG: phage replisome organizer N-terminal domain-containing protein [Clostridia bacterium]|nr:phage replisome organizer N-terminal domain-containing protein [Clostridia bacterium]